MHWSNVQVLVAEGVVYFALMAALLRFRRQIGIGVLFCALGTMHFLETYLASVLYVPVAGTFAVSPGSIVLFSGKLVMLLLVYIEEDARTVRQPIFGLLIGNLLILALVVLLRRHELGPVGAGAPADFAFVEQMGWLMAWGTALLFLDSLLIVLLYERARAAFGGRQLPAIVASAAIVLTFDQVAFYLVLRALVDAPLSVLAGGWGAKMVAAVLYGLLAAAYLRWLAPAAEARERSDLEDLFGILTYRKRYEALLEQAGRDSLTGLLARSRWDEGAQDALEAARAAGRPLGLVLLDVDHFKQVNDIHGHAAGDEVLRRIGQVMTNLLREGDLAFRYGGEEFAILCPNTSPSGAMLLAESLRREIGALELPAIGGRVTMSAGVAVFPVDGETIAALFATADRHLYQAKAQGRDRVVATRPKAPEGAGLRTASG